jgi:hypothetical protein
VDVRCPERDFFMRGLRAHVGFKQTGVDYIRPDRMFDVSTNNFMKNLDWKKKGIFSFSNAPLTMLTTAGIGKFEMSFILSMIMIILRLVNPDIAPRGSDTMLLAICIFGSLNLFAISLIREYMVKIMAKLKERPRLIRTGLIQNGRSINFLTDGKELN